MKNSLRSFARDSAPFALIRSDASWRLALQLKYEHAIHLHELGQDAPEGEIRSGIKRHP